MACHQLIYISRPTIKITAAVLLDILKKSENKNHPHQISGLLVFHNGQFMQLMEGEKKAVRNLFETVKHDPRHTDVEIVLEVDSPERCMPAWAMGFSMSDSVDSEISNQVFYISIDDTKQICKLMKGDVGLQFLKFLGS